VRAIARICANACMCTRCTRIRMCVSHVHVCMH